MTKNTASEPHYMGSLLAFPQTLTEGEGLNTIDLLVNKACFIYKICAKISLS
jgi:hypothetical protein